MEKRQLGRSGLDAGVVGLGCWAMGGDVWGDTRDQASIATIQKAIDTGINFIDTAPIYGHGHSEKLVGQAIKGRRDDIILATKCGLKWDTGEIERVSSRERIMEEIDDSLARLEVEVIDLYQVHWPDENTPIEETMGALVELQEKGKIKHIGVSNYDAAQMKEAMKYCQLVSLQPPYNMFQRGIEDVILPFCRKNFIGVVSYGPMYQGFLTGKFHLTDKKPEDPLRSQHHELQGERFDINREALLKLKEIADANNKTLGQLAINWVICQAGVTVAIVGARSPEQVEQNVVAEDWRLSRQELDHIEEILESRSRRIADLEAASAS